MANLNLWQLEMIPWYAFMIFWLLTALKLKTTKSTEPLAARVYTRLLLAAAFVLLFTDVLKSSPLGQRFLPNSPWIVVTGLVLTYVGSALAIWARWNIGSNWSSRVSLKFDHELIRSGPYARFRHPIYSGMLLAVIGTAMFIGQWRGLLAIVIVGVGHSWKAKREEALMLATFGEKYESYRQQTGFLLPKL